MEEKVKWEYLIAEYDGMTVDETGNHMLYLGGLGWELTSINGNRAYFKRPLMRETIINEYVNMDELKMMIRRIVADEIRRSKI